jgi:hypothetical protein
MKDNRNPDESNPHNEENAYFQNIVEKLHSSESMEKKIHYEKFQSKIAVCRTRLARQ